MKSLVFGALLFGCAACSSSSTSGGGSAPKVTSVTVTPTTLTVGVQALAATIGFDDADSDVTTLVLETKTNIPNVQTAAPSRLDVKAATSGKASGQIQLQIQVQIPIAGQYQALVTLEDSKGNKSAVSTTTLEAK